MPYKNLFKSWEKYQEAIKIAIALDRDPELRINGLEPRDYVQSLGIAFAYFWKRDRPLISKEKLFDPDINIEKMDNLEWYTYAKKIMPLLIEQYQKSAS